MEACSVMNYGATERKAALDRARQERLMLETAARTFPELSVRIRNALWRGGIRTRGEVAALSCEELCLLRGMSHLSCVEILDCIREAPSAWLPGTRTPRLTVVLLRGLLEPYPALREELVQVLRSKQPAKRRRDACQVAFADELADALG
jgi:hypothetical protein